MVLLHRALWATHLDVASESRRHWQPTTHLAESQVLAEWELTVITIKEELEF